MRALCSIKHLVIAILVCLCCATPVFAAAPVLSLSLAPTAPETVLNFSAANQPNYVRCNQTDFPDNPPRAFIMNQTVWMWASNSQAFESKNSAGGFIKKGGQSLNDAFSMGACTPAFTYQGITPTNQNEQTSLAAYQNLLWLVEFWSDANGVSALAHNEFHGQDLADCTSHTLQYCWYANVIAANWNASQQQFVLATTQNKVQPVFVSPVKYQAGNGMQGLGAQTNIIQNPQDGYYYILMMDNPSAINNQEAGMCLFRTNNVADPNSWMGLGEDNTFSVKRNVNPYLSSSPDLHPCKQVLPSAYRFALVYSPRYKTFIALGVNAPNMQNQSILYTTTQDLTNWNWQKKDPLIGKTLNFPNFMWMTFWTMTQPGDSFNAQGYLSLMDPSSPTLSRLYFSAPDNNFQYVGTHPYLYYVYFHAKVTGKMGSSLKDVVRQQLILSCTANCPHIQQ